MCLKNVLIYSFFLFLEKVYEIVTSLEHGIWGDLILCSWVMAFTWFQNKPRLLLFDVVAVSFPQ